jgi:hypothetical protein
MTFAQYVKPRYRLVEEEHSMRDSTASAAYEGVSPKEKDWSPLPAPPGGVIEDTATTAEMRGSSPVLTEGQSTPTPSSKNLWKAFRVAGYQRLILSLLQRGGCEMSIELGLQLLRDMAQTERLTMHQSQVRSLLHCAILNDQAQPLPQELDALNRVKPSGKEEG